ncbi:MAG: tetratricopeptide repeat protein [Ferruginibacter sp.]|nr:tetratricopeptide repeat protein [Ferruginibacter sp.]
MKTLLVAFVTILFAGSLFAQSIDEGKKFLYYERYKSAKDIFQKLSSANPSDETAAYYLGQAMIGLEDLAVAKAFYQQKLSANPNSPLILAGMGNVELLEGKTADARSRFETAISLSANKRIDVLNAVGAPNSNPEIKNGDANYAIDKLKLATTLKGFKDPEVWANLGDAYRKNSDGGQAIQSYDAALRLNPNYARAIYRKGRLYQSQGLSQEVLYNSLYNEAIAKDASYAPVYETQFNYYYKTDVPKSAQYLEKWLVASDDDPKACYYRASMQYAQGLFAEAITKSDECIATQGINVYPSLYGVKALAYNRLGDSVNAKTTYEEYFKKQPIEKVGPGDYSAYAMILLKFSGNEAQAATYVEKAVALDSIEANRVSYLKALGTAYRTQKNFGESAKWFNQVLSIKKNYSNVDLYNAGYDYFRAGMFDSSVAVFNKYTVKYTDDIFGYYMIAKANGGIDTTLTTGLAMNAYLKAIEIGEKAPDKAKIKDQLVGAYTFMMQYSYNIKRDQATAVAYADKALALDPTDEQSIKNKDFVSKNDPNAKVTPAKPVTTKPATTKPKSTPKKK